MIICLKMVYQCQNIQMIIFQKMDFLCQSTQIWKTSLKKDDMLYVKLIIKNNLLEIIILIYNILNIICESILILLF